MNNQIQKNKSMGKPKPKKNIKINISQNNKNKKKNKPVVKHNYLPLIPTTEFNCTVETIFTDQEMNSMDYSQFLIYDKRTLLQMYFSFLNYKAPIFFIFHYYNSSPNGSNIYQIKYPSVKLIFFCIQIYICFFFNASVFGTKSAAYQFNGTYTFWKHLGFSIILCPFCLIIHSLLHFLIFNEIKKKIIEIKLWCFTKLIIDKNDSNKKKRSFEFFTKKEVISIYHKTLTKIEDIHPNDVEKRVKHQREELKRLFLEFFKSYQKRIYFAMPIMFLFILVIWYFVTALCVAFKNSQGNFLLNVFLTFFFCNIIPCGYCFIPAYFRQKAFKEKNKTTYIFSRVLCSI